MPKKRDAPHGTLAFRSYLLMIYGNLKCNETFGGLEALSWKNKTK